MPAGTRVTIRARGLDQRGAWWASWAAFIVPDGDILDLASTAPTEGSYIGADPMGLIWSMIREDGSSADQVTTADVLAPVPLLLTAEYHDQPIASRRVDRLRLPDGVTRTDIRTQGLVGSLFTPQDGPCPGVLLLGGSEGGLHEDDAALLAAHGYTVLALAYFGVVGVPSHLVRLPVEYFGRALRHLACHDDVRGQRVAVVGASFGGQAALLAGAMFDDVAVVVSLAGSGVITQGIDGDIVDGDFLRIMDTEVAPWTWRGAPLPFITDPATPAVRRQAMAGEPVVMRPAFEYGMQDTERLAAATIPVERIQGAVLLISAGDDHQWPSDALSDIALSRLSAYRHPYAYQHVRYPAAGHGICVPPFLPTTDTIVPGPGVLLALGGTPADTAAAQHAAWTCTLDFLATHLRT